VEGGTGGDIDTIVIDGEILLADGKATRVDEAALLRQIQERAQPLWDSVPDWRARGETIDDVAPLSYPIRRGVRCPVSGVRCPVSGVRLRDQ